MKLGGLVLSTAHVGRERRKTPPELRAEYREQNVFIPPDPDEGGTWWSAVPKRLLVTVLALVAAGLLWHERSWREVINTHVAGSAAGYVRLTTVEARVATMQSEISELRRDALYSFIAEADAKGNKTLADMFRRRLKEMEKAQ